MATYTSNYNLKKPASSDTVDIADINGNMDIIDTAINDAQTLSNKAKGLCYVVPTVEASNRWVATIPGITAYYDGLMVSILCPASTVSGLTLNINNLGGVGMVYLTSNEVGSRYGAGNVLTMIYRTYEGVAKFAVMDYTTQLSGQVHHNIKNSNQNLPIVLDWRDRSDTSDYNSWYIGRNPDFYYNPSTKILTVSEVVANLTGTATKATGDEDGTNIKTNYAKKSELNAKQDTLVSGTNIKTLNGRSLLGSGDLSTVSLSSVVVNEVN